MRKSGILLFCVLTQAFNTAAADGDVIYSPEDSTEIEKWLSEAPSGESARGLTLFFAYKMAGRPYVAHTLEAGDEEHLIVNVRELDCTTFAESSAALAITARQGGKRFADYCGVMRALRYRGGITDGYPSRLHYFSEWIADNEKKGLVSDLGKEKKPPFTAVQVIDASFMSSNPQHYKRLKNDTAMTGKIREMEKSISGKQVSYIPKHMLGKGEGTTLGVVKDGDIIALITSKKGLEISHVGIAVWQNGKLHLLNASSIHGKVVLDSQTLFEYQKKRKSQLGIRAVRVN